jgi:hypothetical protein
MTSLVFKRSYVSSKKKVKYENGFYTHAWVWVFSSLSIYSSRFPLIVIDEKVAFSPLFIQILKKKRNGVGNTHKSISEYCVSLTQNKLDVFIIWLIRCRFNTFLKENERSRKIRTSMLHLHFFNVLSEFVNLIPPKRYRGVHLVLGYTHSRVHLIMLGLGLGITATFLHRWSNDTSGSDNNNLVGALRDVEMSQKTGEIDVWHILYTSGRNIAHVVIHGKVMHTCWLVHLK